MSTKYEDQHVLLTKYQKCKVWEYKVQGMTQYDEYKVWEYKVQGMTKYDEYKVWKYKVHGITKYDVQNMRTSVCFLQSIRVAKYESTQCRV